MKPSRPQTPLTPSSHGDNPPRDAVGAAHRPTAAWKHPSVWGPTLLLAGLYALMGARGWLPFHTNDDVAIIGILRGVPAVAPSGFTLQLSPWYGEGLAFLYRFWPSGHWYELAIVSCYVLGFGWILRSMRHNGWTLTSMLLAMVTCIMGFLLWQPGFTLVAQFLTAAAVAPLITQLPTKPLRRLSRGEVCMSIFLMLLGIGYRVDAAGLALGVATIGFAILRGREIIGGNREVWRAMAVLAVLFGMLLAGRVISAAIPASPEAARWREYNTRRAAILDYSSAVYDPAWENRLGLSHNDFNILTNHMAMDFGPFRLERLKMIPLNAPSLTVRGVVSTVMTSMGPEAFIIMIAVALACLFRPRLLLVAGSTLLILCLVQWHYDRLPPRVLLPPLGLLAMMSVGAIERPRGFGRWFYCHAMVGLVLSASWVVAHSLPGQLAWIRRLDRNESRVRQFCDAHGIDRLLFWNGTPGSMLLFRDPAGCAGISYGLGGWDSSHPAKLAARRKYFGDDLFAGVRRPGTYHCLVGLPARQLTLKVLFREHGLPHTRLEKVFHSGPVVLYQVVCEDDAASQPVQSGL